MAMADLTADLFLSLDGFAAGVDVGPFFGYGGPELDSWVHDAQTRPQLVVMGRVTYEVMAQISSSATDEGSTRMNEAPKAVFSNTLSEPLAWQNTCLIRGDLFEGMRALKHDSPTRSARSAASPWCAACSISGWSTGSGSRSSRCCSVTPASSPPSPAITGPASS